MDKDNAKIKPVKLKNNLLLYKIFILALKFPSIIHNIKSNSEIKPAFPGIIVCGRAIEKHKIIDKKNINLLGVTNLKNVLFMLKPIVISRYIYIIFIIVSSKMVIGEEIIYEKKSHADSVDSLCVNGKNIVSASFDGSIKTTNNNETTIIGKHNDWVRKVICTDSNIISASNDGMITIWSDYKKIKSIQAHSWWITDIVLSGDKIVSVSLDETVKVWSYPELKLLYSHKLYGSNKHYSIAVNNGKAFIGSTHGLMSILDISSFEWIESKMIAGTYAILISATKSKKHIIFGSSDGFIIKVMASPPYNMLKEKISNFALKAVAQSEGILYVGDDNGVIRKISIDNIKEPYVLSRFPEAVRALTIDNDLIYAGYDNGHIRIFNKMAKISGKQE